jgi:hypothetical protein
MMVDGREERQLRCQIEVLVPDTFELLGVSHRLGYK